MTRLYAHVLLGVPGAVRTEIASYLDENTQRGEALREMMKSLHRERVCIAPYRGTNYHVYLITVDDDQDAGNIRLLLNRWPSIKRLAAFRQTGEQLGQTRNADGTITGTPRFQLSPAEYAELKAAWPAEFVVNGSMIIPPNIVQGQIIWTL